MIQKINSNLNFKGYDYVFTSSWEANGKTYSTMGIKLNNSGRKDLDIYNQFCSSVKLLQPKGNLMTLLCVDDKKKNEPEFYIDSFHLRSGDFFKIDKNENEF